MERKCGVVLVPFPLTPLSVFAYFLFKRMGRIGDDVFVRFDMHPQSTKERTLTLVDGWIINLAIRHLWKEVESAMATASAEHWSLHWSLWRYATYCRANKAGNEFSRWIAKLMYENPTNPKMALHELCQLLDGWATRGLDPWKEGGVPPAPRPQVIDCVTQYPPDIKFLSIPVFNEEDNPHRPDANVVKIEPVKLREGMICGLQNNHLSVVVGGPPGSGKSTLVVSVVEEMRNIVNGLKTRRGWEHFSLSIECLNLDLGTPTTDAIEAGMGRDRATIDLRKRPWTIDLALEAAQRLASARARSNLVIADLPGKITDCTSIVGVQADVGIIITNNWDVLPNWNQYFHDMGVPVPCRLRSRPMDGTYSSAITTYGPGRFISGRVVGLNRTGRHWDGAISWVSEFLLFDLLPSLIMKRQAVIEKLVRD